MSEEKSIPATGHKLKKSEKSYNDFRSILEELDKSTYPEINVPLFHYTNIDAFQGIVNSRKIWLTNIFTQKNDPFEIRSGLEIFYQELTSLVEEAEFSGTRFFADMLIEMLKKHIEGAGHFFLFCASKIKDDPHQWATFGVGGKGVCLEFSNVFSKSFSDVPDGDDGEYSNGQSLVSDVYYDDKHFRKELITLLDDCIKAVEKGLKDTNPDEKDALLFLRYMSVEIITHIIPYCVRYKPEKFSKENETRFLRVVRKDRMPRGRKEHRHGENVKFYVEHPLAKEDLAVVWVGPLMPAETAEKLKENLMKEGWTSTKVKKSEIPF